MNTADLCPEGLLLYEEFLQFNNTYQEFQRVHMMYAMTRSHQVFLHHINNECDRCTERTQTAHQEE